ncbi:MAG: hypothetical protein LBN93_08520 [Candidatus Symbiothrix sp.]|jgi:hypothetical protein|nr:hypothetical protein [Candidatus Symbiothrix sp.]
MKKHIFGHVIFGLALVAGFSAAVMLLWNALIPGIFGLTVINFWQSLGLLALARLLFGCGFGGKIARAGVGGHGSFNKNPMREKWMNMTPEERKAFIKNMKDRRNRHPFGTDFRHDFQEDYDLEQRERDDFMNDESKKDTPRG